MKEAQNELSKPGLNSFGLGDCKAPKVLGDIFESIAGAIFLDSGRDTTVVWQVTSRILTYNLLYHLFCVLPSIFLVLSTKVVNFVPASVPTGVSRYRSDW